MKLLDIKEKIWLLDDENFNFPTLEQMGGDLVAIGGDFHPQRLLNAYENEEAVESIMSGNIWKIGVKEGDKVKAGEVLVILESMKMEVDIETNISGTVEKILFKEGDNINSGDVLIIIKKDEK